MSIKYIGRTTDFCGKTLWEILGNLKNFGVGRVVVRHTWQQRYKEPSYIRILKVEALPEPEVVSMDNFRKVKVLVERVFRGKKFEKPLLIESASYKTDYRLLSKKDEIEYCKLVSQQEKILPTHMEVPPLLKEFLIKETGRDEHMMKIHYKPSMYKTSRIAKEGEKPNIEVNLGLGKPASPSLYEGIQL